MRFQTKLMWAFFLATAAVSVAVIQLSSQRVKRNYQKQFEDRFSTQVDYLLNSRRERSEKDKTRAQSLAQHDYVAACLSSDKTERQEARTDKERRQEFLKFALLGSRNSVTNGNAISNRGLANNQSGPLAQRLMQLASGQLIGIMDMEGEVYLFTDSAGGGAKKSRKPKGAIQKKLELLKDEDEQQIAYLPRKTPNGGNSLRELVLSPVLDSSGKSLGAFLLGLPTTETSAERVIDLYYQKVGGDHFENGIYYDGNLYPSSLLGNRSSKRRGSKGGGKKGGSADDHDHHNEIDNADFLAIGESAKRQIENLNDEAMQGDFEVSVHGDPHLVHFCALNPDSPLETAYQITAYPMSQLHKELNDLRIKGSGIGLIGILIGCLASWLLSRNLSVPINELATGTRKIQNGDLNTELKVRSKDELGQLTESFNQMTSELRQKERYRELLEKVSDESVAQAMIEGSLQPQLGGELKEMSVLFCDIRGFTSLTESMRPEDVIELLNLHMTALADVVREHYGVVDKFIGDEIMAVFGGLKSYGNDAENAARCALKMIAERNRLNHETGADIQIGIGVATGEMVAGCMGSQDRLNYTVLGANVNLGARLCGQAGRGEVVIDEATYAKICHLAPAAETITGLQLKGFSEGMQAWKLSNLATASADGVSSVTV